MNPTAMRRLKSLAAGILLAWSVSGEASSPSSAGAVIPRGPATPILLNSGEVRADSVPARATSNESFAGKRLHLVQLAGPVQPDAHAELRASGATLVSYIPENAYLVWGDAASIAKVEALAASSDRFAWAGTYGAEAKLDRGLRGSPKSGDERSTLVAVQLIHDEAINRETIERAESLASGPILGRSEVLHYVNLVLEIEPARMLTLAQRPDVVSIQPWATPVKLGERQAQITAGNLSGGSPSAPGYLPWLASRGFTQAQFTTSGFLVDVSDSGIDDGSITPNHPGLREGGVAGGASRVAYMRLEGTPNGGSTLIGCDGHGTLNAHLVAGFIDLGTFPHTDAAGFRYGLGVAPFVKIGSSVIFDPDAYTFPDFTALQSRAWEDGARISLNPWGSANGGRYDVTAQAFDALARDAQQPGSPFPTAGNQEMVLVVAAGNDGPSTHAIHSPATAKNVLTIGASENVQTYGTDSCGVSDDAANDARELAGFSSRGPTFDGRRKPDLVAPGSHVSGGVPQSLFPGATGQADGCFDSAGLCSPPVGPFFPQGQQFYTASSGTSHAAAGAAGAAALLRQHFINLALPPPSPAMTRAYLANAATRLAAGTEWPMGIGQGMGRIDLGKAFDATPRILRDQVPADVLTASGESRTFVITQSDPAQPMTISLAWTDAPGSTAAAAWANDLDLAVWADGVEYLGNVFAGDLSQPGGVPDTRNNFETIVLPPGFGGVPIAVQVRGANINSDGVPGVGGLLDQDFALVISNAVPVASPVIVPVAAVLGTESCTPPNSVIDPHEVVSIGVTLANLGSTPTANLVATLLADVDVINPGPAQSYGALAPGASLARTFTFRARAGCSGTLTARIALADGAQQGSVEFEFPVGVRDDGDSSFDNPSPVSIPDVGTATPYPSMLSVSGVTGVAVEKYTVTLYGLTHGFADDLDVLLVGPGGQKVILMSDAGAGDDLAGATLTFDDDAPFPLPDGSGIASGAYRPTNHGTGDVFPGPAPGPPYGTSLSAFEASSPNGTWRLYVVDDTEGDAGSLAGWSLGITTTDLAPECCVMPGTLQFVSESFSVIEPGLAQVLIGRTFGDAGSVSVSFATSDGTAVAGADYIAVDAVVTFGPGEGGSKSVGIVVLDDSFDELAETVNLTLSAPTGGAVLGARSTAVLNIEDNDPTPLAAIPDQSVAEGDSGTTEVTLTVTLSAASSLPISMSWQTLDGTATAGSDYVSASGTLDYPPGTVSRSLSVTVNGDTANELDETFFVALADPVHVVLPPAATVTIVSDDVLTVTSIAPTSGPSAGGTAVTVAGTHIEAGATLHFGASAASGVSVTPPGQIEGTTPALAPGVLHDVVVTNANAISATFPRGFLADFLDVPGTSPLHPWVESIFRAGITSGCGGGNYCPNAPVTRAQMAVFLLRGMHGGAYAPAPATGTVFADVQADGFAAAWIEQLAAEGVTAGCATDPPRYCPGDAVTRAQMAVFLLRAKHGSAYVPPPAAGVFDDVPAASPFAPWIEQLAAEGVTAGCSSAPPLYCPDAPNTRGQMAVFVDKTFDPAPLGLE